MPFKDSRGRGDRLFNSENILEATQAGELTRAGDSSKQLQKLFTAQRARMKPLSPGARLVVRFRMYIETIKSLADTFGRGPGYDDWLATQTRMLKQMEKDLQRLGKDAGPELDARLLRSLGQADKTANRNQPPALAE